MDRNQQNFLDIRNKASPQNWGMMPVFRLAFGIVRTIGGVRKLPTNLSGAVSHIEKKEKIPMEEKHSPQRGSPVVAYLVLCGSTEVESTRILPFVVLHEHNVYLTEPHTEENLPSEELSKLSSRRTHLTG